MTQKGDRYRPTKLFSTLSGVRLMPCIFSQLNVLYTSLVKPCYSKNDDSPVIHRSRLTAILPCSLTYWISLKRSAPYIKTFSTLSGVRLVFWILPQLDILCTSAVKWYYSKNDNSPFKCHLFYRVLEFMKARKTCHRVVRTSILVRSLLWSALQQKLYRQDFRDVDCLKRVLLHCLVS